MATFREITELITELINDPIDAYNELIMELEQEGRLPYILAEARETQADLREYIRGCNLLIAFINEKQRILHNCYASLQSLYGNQELRSQE